VNRLVRQVYLVPAYVIVRMRDPLKLSHPHKTQLSKGSDAGCCGSQGVFLQHTRLLTDAEFRSVVAKSLPQRSTAQAVQS
jgi:hypothetical protein